MGAVSFGAVSVSSWMLSAGESRAHEPIRGEATAWLHIACEGVLEFLPRGGHGDVVAPGAVVIRTGAAHRMRALRESQLVSLRFPDEVLVGLGVEDDTAAVAASDSALLQPLAHFAARAARSAPDEASSLAAYYFERLLQEMVIGLVVDAARSHAVPRAPEHFTLALSLITAQLADTDLSPASIARELNTSLRQLQRRFRERDTTVEREIRRARVAYAVRLLRDRSYDALSVDEVARFAGFSGGSSLARALAGEGEAPPAQVRKLARAASSVRV